MNRRALRFAVTLACVPVVLTATVYCGTKPRNVAAQDGGKAKVGKEVGADLIFKEFREMSDWASDGARDLNRKTEARIQEHMAARAQPIKSMTQAEYEAYLDLVTALQSSERWEDDISLDLARIEDLEQYFRGGTLYLARRNPEGALNLMEGYAFVARRLCTSRIVRNRDAGDRGLLVIASTLGEAAVKFPHKHWEEASPFFRAAEPQIGARDYIQQGYVNGLDDLNLRIHAELTKSGPSRGIDSREFTRLVHEEVLKFWSSAAEAWRSDAKGLGVAWGGMRAEWLRTATTSRLDLAPEFAWVLKEAVPREAPVAPSADWFPRDLWYWFVSACRADGKAPAGIEAARDKNGVPIFFNRSSSSFVVSSYESRERAGTGLRMFGNRHISWQNGMFTFSD